MSNRDLWNKILDQIDDRISPSDIDVWLSDAELLRVEPQRGDGDTAQARLTVQVPNHLYVDWITDNHLPSVTEAASRVLRADVTLNLIARTASGGGGGSAGGAERGAPRRGSTSSADSHEPFPDALDDDDTVSPRATRGSSDERGSELSASMALDPLMTLDRFVVGPCNQFANAAARAVCDEPATRYNPLFIYGDTGLGKTHLLQAIGHSLSKNPHKLRIVYVTAESFTNDLINHIRYRRMDTFRARYRQHCDVLLIDDIQFIGGKERTQEEFFHTFNELASTGRQIVLTSDVQPKHIVGLEPRLRTRFDGGLVADMHAPDRETLLAILRQNTEGLGLEIAPDVAEVIVTGARGNVRELSGVLKRIAALKEFYQEPLTIDFLRKHVPRLVQPTLGHTFTVAEIIESVAQAHNLRVADLISKKRTRTLTDPRHIAMFVARKLTGLSFPELGREFGGRDHSTIQHGVHKVEEHIAKDPDLRTKVERIERALTHGGRALDP
jgi:chromosomal replication initiator protein